MNAALELFSEFIEEPQHAARLAIDRRPWHLGLLALVVSATSLFLAQPVSHHFLPVASGLASWFLVCLWTVLTGFLLTATLNLLAEAWGGSGSGVALFVLVGMSELAWALVLPCALVLKAVRLDGWVSLFWLILFAAVASLRLKARSLRHVYGLSGTRAWALLLIPYIGAFVLVSAVGAAAVVSAVVSLAGLFK